MIKKRSWLAIVFASLALIAVALLSYVFWFYGHLDRKISSSPEQWGQFGDYLGGLLNPILSFISICILVKTAFYQADESKRREDREDRRRFEDRFYGALSYQRQSFNDFSLTLLSGGELNRSDAVKFIENLLFDSFDHESLSDASVKNSVFSFVRQFYLILKMIDDEVVVSDVFNGSDKAFYYRSLINLTDFDLIRMVIFGSVYYDSWLNSKYIMSNKDFLEVVDSVGLSKYIAHVRALKLQN